MEAHQKQKKSKYNFVEQFQRSEIPCPGSLRSFDNQTAVNPLLIAALAEQAQRHKTKRQTGGRPFYTDSNVLTNPLFVLFWPDASPLRHLHSPSYRNHGNRFSNLQGEKLPKQSEGSFVQVILSYGEKIRSRIISALQPRSED